MKKKPILILIFALIISISYVSALETAQDDIIAPSSYISDNYQITGTPDSAYTYYTTLQAINIEYISSAPTLIHFDKPGWSGGYSVGAPAYAEDDFIAEIGAVEIGSGRIGYQRRYDAGGAEIAGLQYLIFTSYDITGFTGQQVITITYSTALVPMIYNRHLSGGPTVVDAPTGYLYFDSANAGMLGYYTLNTDFNFVNSYSATKPIGLNIVGTIWKYGLAGPPIYNSRAFVINATDQQIIASEPALSGTSLHFNIPTESIYIAVKDSRGNFHNTSTLFTVPTPAVGSYSILINPSTITLPSGSAQGNIVATIVDLNKLTDISWWWSDEGSPSTYDFYENGNASRPLDYTKIGGVWYGYETSTPGLGGGYTHSKGTSIPNPVSLSNISSTGTKTITCFIGTSDGYWYTLTGTLTVTGDVTTTAAVMIDWQTGNRIYYGTISFKNLATGLWTNQTPTTGGIVYVVSSPAARFDIYGSAFGYTNGTPQLGVPARSTGIYSLFMYPITNATPIGTTLLYVTVEDTVTLVGISGAQVTLTSTSNTTVPQLHSTSNGMTTFTTEMNTNYFVAVNAFGYEGATQTVSIVTDPMYSIHIGLTKITAGATPTPYPTDAGGQPVSESEANALDAFLQLARALPAMFNIGIGIIMIWLMWILVYELTGGKVLDKLMKRGRK